MGETSFTKLFASIIHSTIWRESDDVRVVWITMLAMCDSEGYVGASLPGLADAARVSVERCRAALDLFMAPDPDSRCKEQDGRRVETAERGWRVLNYEKHRSTGSAEMERQRKRDWWREHRGKQASDTSDSLAETRPSRYKQKQKQKEKQIEPPPTPPTGGPEGGGRTSPGTPERTIATDGNGQDRIARFKAFWESAHSSRGPTLWPGNANERIAELLAAFPKPTELAARVARFMADDDAWIPEHGGWTLAVFCGRVDKYAKRKAKAESTPSPMDAGLKAELEQRRKS